jgi:hypothetical protein
MLREALSFSSVALQYSLREHWAALLSDRERLVRPRLESKVVELKKHQHIGHLKFEIWHLISEDASRCRSVWMES